VSHVFNYDTPWHPDDYVHRIGRTGRAGATGRAFTLFTDEDAEAIANVEKLTGGAIPVYKLDDSAAEATGEESRERDSGRRSRRDADRPAREDKPRRERSAREERPARDDRPAREERPVRDNRYRDEPRGDEFRREEPRREPRHEPAEPPSAPGEWNGPVPEFLAVSALPR
jgi:superfamily II DNA/RNA helicase